MLCPFADALILCFKCTSLSSVCDSIFVDFMTTDLSSVKVPFFSSSMIDDSSAKSSTSSPNSASTSFRLNDRFVFGRSMRLIGCEPNTDEASTNLPSGDLMGDFVFFSFLRFGLKEFLAASSSSSLDMTSALAFRLGGADGAAVGDAAMDADSGFLAANEKYDRMSCNRNANWRKMRIQYLIENTYGHRVLFFV